jgi:arylsulfatase A-like enzyme
MPIHSQALRNPTSTETYQLMKRLLAIALTCTLCNLLSAAESRPNIIVMMSDDMGYSDLGCYGGEIATPHLDALATGGLRFTQFYNTARCCPTRAALLTGLYPHQAGIGHMMEDRGSDGYRGDLNRRCVTIAEALKPAGYRTYMLGKWHVTKKTKPANESEKFNWPLQRGFDRYYGTIHGAGSFFDPISLTRDNQYISPFADPQYQPSEYFYTDALADHAVRFVSEHARDHAAQPFFMYLAFTSAHWPMHAKETDLAKYKGKYDAGYDAIRDARWERMKSLGLINPQWKMASQRGGDWNAVKNREFETRCMETYAAMIDCMDQGIGRLVAELKRQQQLDNTLILFLQDNGGCAEVMGRSGNFQPRAERPPLPPLAADYIQPDMIPKQTRDGYPVRQGYGVLPGPADTFIGYGEAWANVSNTPFREYKHWVHEGGISSPLIAHWPAGIPASRKNGFEKQPAHLIDLMATCVDLAGATYPAKFQDTEIQPLEGVSLRPAFAGEPLARRQPIFFEHEGNRAVRENKWKLVAKGPGGPWELYDIEADRSEAINLAEQQPERVKAMTAQWEQWAHRAKVLPWIWNPPYGEEATPGKATRGKAKKKKKKAA